MISTKHIHAVYTWHHLLDANGIKLHDDGILLNLLKFYLMLPNCVQQWYCWWTKSCTTKDDDYPIIYRVLTIPGGAGFFPSTVLKWYPNIYFALLHLMTTHYQQADDPFNPSVHVSFCAKFQCFLGSLRYQWTAMNIKDQLLQMELRQLLTTAAKLDILQLWEVRKP